jgi:serine/threonine protein kinase
MMNLLPEDKFFSRSFIDLVTKMMKINPLERLSLCEIKSHEWFQKHMKRKIF